MVDETVAGIYPLPVTKRNKRDQGEGRTSDRTTQKAERPVLFIGNGARQAHLAGMVEE